MTTKATTKNGHKQADTEFVLDIAEMRDQLGINELEAKIELLNQILGEWLLYVNMVDERVQRLDAEPVMTKKHKLNIGADGSIELERQRPPLPENLLAQGTAPTSPKLIK